MKCAVLLLCLVLAGTANAARPAAEPHNELVTLNESRCQACTDLLSLLQTRLQDPTMQQQLMQYVIQDVCPQLPQSDRTQCSLFAPLVIASAIGWVREQSPVTICTRVSLCPATVRSGPRFWKLISGGQEGWLAPQSCLFALAKAPEIHRGWQHRPQYH